VGGCWVTSLIDPDRNRFGSDLHPDLIEMWNSLQSGWIPPDIVSREEYHLLKNSKEISALKGFVGFGCSFSGKWFGGYAGNNTGRNYACNAKNSLMKKLPGLKNVEFRVSDYTGIEVCPKSLIYCDPPYKGTTGYSLGGFDHEEFWQWVRYQSKENTVLVSEYEAPEDFTCVWSKITKTDMRVGDGVKEMRIEKLYQCSLISS
jgi:DNA adenine methylase